MALFVPPQPRFVDVERFEVGDPLAVSFFEERGFVVFREALTKAEVSEAEELLWRYLESVSSSLDRDDPSTWAQHWPPAVGSTGILAFLGVGQSEFMWFVRTRPTVIRAFQQLWRQRNLLVSFDGCCAWRWGRDYPPKEGWFHCDQNFLRRPTFECVQGLVNLHDCDETTGGNLLVDGSHRTIFPKLQDHFESMGRHCDDYFELPVRTDPRAGDLLRDKPHVVLKLKAGDLLCFDSRTIHCSAPPLREEEKRRGNFFSDSSKEEQQQQQRLRRAAAFVSYVPKANVPDDVIARRADCIKNATTSTHWVTKLQPTTSYSTWELIKQDQRRVVDAATDDERLGGPLQTTQDEPQEHHFRLQKKQENQDDDPASPFSFTKRPDCVPPDVLFTRPDIRSLVLGDTSDDDDDMVA
mmetsp:Transcript_4477/g.14862  ORF Transcript_4477/g.14862 Transcript_4477/m.14862 type:complete len:410 (+) Transcript_4477:255-1484(+)